MHSIRSTTPGQWFGIVFLVSLVSRLVLILLPMRPMWDGTVYLGMARLIGSGGTIGYWELFRPPFWPLVLSIFSWVGPGALEWVARVLVMLCSLGLLYFVYRLGENIRPFVGVGAAFPLSFSGPFFGYSVVPMTEIPSLFLLVVSIYFFTERKLFLAGLIAGFAFLTRFPIGLIVLAFGGVTLIDLIHVRTKETLYLWIQNVGMLMLGFIIPVMFFLIANKVFYGDMFLPLVVGPKMIADYLWLYAGDAFFYVSKIIQLNPIAYISVAALFYIIAARKYISSISRRVLLTSFFASAIFFVYFSLQAHKELRYILPVYPFLFLFVSLGIQVIWKKVNVVGKLVLGVFIIFCLVSSVVVTQTFTTSKSHANKYYDFYSAVSDDRGAVVLSSTPAVAAFSPVRMIEGYNSWEHIDEVYEARRGDFSYVMIDSCELHVCVPGSESLCRKSKEEFLTKLHEEVMLVYDATIESCNLSIYKTK